MHHFPTLTRYCHEARTLINRCNRGDSPFLFCIDLVEVVFLAILAIEGNEIGFPAGAICVAKEAISSHSRVGSTFWKLVNLFDIAGATPPGFQTIQRNANLGCAFDINHFLTTDGSSENALEHFQFVR
jgi:hypothetical protein